jgi:dihydropteroate synthase
MLSNKIFVKEILSYKKLFQIEIEDLNYNEYSILKNYLKNKKIEEYKENIVNNYYKIKFLINLDEIANDNNPLANELLKVINRYKNYAQPIKVNNKILDFKRTYIMGILNVTPDSFYDGGRYFEKEKAAAHALKMVKEGADIIDVGGESTRPGSSRIDAEEEIKRVIPVIKEIRKKSDVLISIDTYKSKVAEEAIVAGADIVNDISGCIADERMPDIIKSYDTPVVVMHIRGNPKIMQRDVYYNNTIKDIIRSLRNRINYLKERGIKEEKIIIDPGIGFGKTVDDNVKIIKNLKDFQCLGRPILIGPSRKSFIGKILDLPAEERLEGTLAVLALCIINGANIIRVHDVKEAFRVAKIVDYIKFSS